MLPHIDILFRLQANELALYLLYAMCLAEKQWQPILKSLVWLGHLARDQTHDLLHFWQALYHKLIKAVYYAEKKIRN